MLKCNHCKREIERDEKIFRINGQIYCSSCVTEIPATVYKIADNPKIYYENATGLKNTDEYIEVLEIFLKNLEKDKKHYEKLNKVNLFKEFEIEMTTKEINELKKIIEELREERK